MKLRTYLTTIVAGLAASFLVTMPGHACEPIPSESVVQSSAPPAARQGREITIVYAPQTWGQGADMPAPQMDLNKVIEMIAQDCDEDVPGKTPTADTAFQRHAGLLPQIPENAREVFVAAEIARSTEQALALLEPLTQAPAPPAVRYRALIEMSLRVLRSADGIPLTRAESFLDAAEELAPDLPRLPDGTDVASDIAFHRAVICWRAEKSPIECRPQLDLALELDVYFAAARQLRIEMNDTLLRRAAALDPGDCNAVLAQVLFDTENLLRGIELPKNRMETAGNLDSVAADGNVVLNMSAAHAYSKAGVISKSDLALTDARNRLAQDGACHAQLRRHFAKFEENLLALRETD